MLLGPALDAHLVARHVLSIETAKQGMTLELTYRAALLSGEAAGVGLQRLDASE